MLDTVKINHVQHISFTQSRLTDAVSVILRELLSYEHPAKVPGFFSAHYAGACATVFYFYYGICAAEPRTAGVKQMNSV